MMKSNVLKIIILITAIIFIVIPKAQSITSEVIYPKSEVIYPKSEVMYPAN